MIASAMNIKIAKIIIKKLLKTPFNAKFASFMVQLYGVNINQIGREYENRLEIKTN